MRERERRFHAAERPRLFALVRKARYAEALREAERHWRAHPEDLHGRYRYATLLGDCQEGLGAKAIERNRRAAVRLLKPLMCRLRAFEPSVRSGVWNEYYWFSRQREKQYHRGLVEERGGGWRGAYSQGVGAAWRALELAQRGQRRRAERWARLSERAWGRFLKRDRYYNAYVHLGLALGVLGRTTDMEKALATGARIAGKPASWHEFEEVRHLVASLVRCV